MAMYTVAILSWYNCFNKRQTIPKGQSKMDNPNKLATYGTQDEEKQIHNAIVLDTTIGKQTHIT
jgi:hypothetical protein